MLPNSTFFHMQYIYKYTQSPSRAAVLYDHIKTYCVVSNNDSVYLYGRKFSRIIRL